MIYSCGEKNKNTDKENKKIKIYSTKEYFEQFLDSKDLFKMIKNSFPTLEDCKKIYNEPFASNYYSNLSKFFLKNDKLNFLDYGYLNHTFNDSIENKYNSLKYTFKDVTYIRRNSNEADSSNKWHKIFKPNINFHKVIFLREIDGKNIDDFDKSEYNGTKKGFDNDGIEFTYFVKLNDKWIFFPEFSYRHYEKIYTE